MESSVYYYYMVIEKRNTVSEFIVCLHVGAGLEDMALKELFSVEKSFIDL